jgi:hypothetical protein
VTHLRDDLGAGVHVFRGGVAAHLEVDQVAGCQLALVVRAVDVSRDDAQTEVEIVLGGDLADDLERPGNVRCGAGAPGRTDDQGILRSVAARSSSPRSRLTITRLVNETPAPR